MFLACADKLLKKYNFWVRSEAARVEKVGRVEEKESRGFYEQQLVNLQPCSLYR